MGIVETKGEPIMAKYNIDFKLTVTASRVIQANSEEEAVAIADDMIRRDGGYWVNIVASMDDDGENWRPKNCTVCSFGVADDTEKADNE